MGQAAPLDDKSFGTRDGGVRDNRVVHVVEHDLQWRTSLAGWLTAAGFAPVLHESPLAALDAVPQLSSACLLIAADSGSDGLEVQRRLNALGVVLPVIVMTAQGDVQTAVQAMQAGVVDCLEKPFGGERLLQAIETAFARMRRLELEHAAAKAAEKIATLSKREREVLEGLVAGRPNKVIARDLGISVRTVEVHRARLLEHLGAPSFAEAIKLAVIAAHATGIPESDAAR
jgi:two-component system response regulator FixJ